MRTAAHQHGLTLIELMVVVVLLGITAAIAVPNFGRMIDTNQHAAAANDFSGLLQYARSEAIRRSNSVAVFPLGNSSAGYGVCPVSALASCKGDPAAAELLRTSNPLAGRVTITQTAPAGGGDLIFRGSGTLGTGGNHTYRICGGAGTEAVDITVNAGGQTRMDTDTNVTCS